MSIEDSCISLCMHCHFLCLLWMLLKKSRLGRWGFRNLGLVDEVLIDALSFHGALVRFTESVGILLFLLITILWCNKSNRSLVLVGRNCFNIVHPAVAYCKGILIYWHFVVWIWFGKVLVDEGKEAITARCLLHRSHEKSPHTRATHEKKKIGKETINTNEKKQDSIVRL